MQNYSFEIIIFIYFVLLTTKSILTYKGISFIKKINSGNPKNRTQVKIAILTPILSGDPKLEEYLEKNLLENFNQANFYWLVDENDTLAWQVVEKILNRNPHISTKIQMQIHPKCPSGYNPKTWKISRALLGLNEEYFLVLDDDTFLPENTLKAITRGLENFTLVTGLPVYEKGKGLFSRLLSEFVNNNSAMTYLSLYPYLGAVSINGMCYASHTGLANREEWYPKILNHLTDDLALAQLLREKNHSILQIYHSQRIETTVKGIFHYIKQMHRWFLFATLLLQSEKLKIQSIVFLFHGLPAFLFWSIFILFFNDILPYLSYRNDTNVFHKISENQFWIHISLLLSILLFRSLIITDLQLKLTNIMRQNPFLSIISELLQPIHLLHALIFKKVQWRTRKFQVKSVTEFYE